MRAYAHFLRSPHVAVLLAATTLTRLPFAINGLAVLLFVRELCRAPSGPPPRRVSRRALTRQSIALRLALPTSAIAGYAYASVGPRR